MRRGRWSIWRLMAVVLVAGVALGLGVPAYRAWSDQEWHMHTYLYETRPVSAWIPSPHGFQQHGFGMEMAQPSTWARFRTRLLGADRGKLGDCGTRIGRIEESCSRAQSTVPDEPDMGH